MNLTQLNTELLLQLNCLLQDKDPLVIKIFKFVPVSAAQLLITRDIGYSVRVGSLSDSWFKHHRRSYEDRCIIKKRLPGFDISLTPRQVNNLVKQNITEQVVKH